MRKSLLSSKGFRPPRSRGDWADAPPSPDRPALGPPRARLSGHFNANRLLSTPRRAPDARNPSSSAHFMHNVNAVSPSRRGEGVGDARHAGPKRPRAWSATREQVEDDFDRLNSPHKALEQEDKERSEKEEEDPKEEEEEEEEEKEEEEVTARRGFVPSRDGLPHNGFTLPDDDNSFGHLQESEADGGEFAGVSEVDLAREVEEERRMSEDLPFTPHVALSPMTAIEGGASPFNSQPMERRWSGQDGFELRKSNDVDDVGKIPGGVAQEALLANFYDPAPLMTAQRQRAWEGASSAGTDVPSSSYATASEEAPPFACPYPNGNTTRTRTTFLFSPSCSNSCPGRLDAEVAAPVEPTMHGLGSESSPAPPNSIVRCAENVVVHNGDGRKGAVAAPPRTQFVFTAAPALPIARNSGGGVVEGDVRRLWSTTPPPSPPPTIAGEGNGSESIQRLGDATPGWPQRVQLSDIPPPCGGSPFVEPIEKAMDRTLLMSNQSNVEMWYDLPLDVRHFFASQRGIRALYPWQHELLTRDDLRAGQSLVYGMPTSGGKTLVAEICLLWCVLNRRRSGLFVLPYVSLAEEKTTALQHLAKALGFTVDGHYGSTGRFPLSKPPAIYVCTIEKANSLLNHLLEEGRGDELGCVVVDELHMLGEARRGATLELFLSKVLLHSERRPASDGVQLLAMSATIPNLPDLARWLRAACYEGSCRPVPLIQYSVLDGLVLRAGVHPERSLCGAEWEHLYELATELPEGSVLVFCASRQQCMEAARGVVHYLTRKVHAAGGDGGEASPLERANLGNFASLPPPTHDLAATKMLREELEGFSHAETALLLELVPYGVAFHHGGLLLEERELIERAYRQRLVRILCCTSTLAAGVNLPARRVIFKTPYIGREFLTKAHYVQMCGRAGRAGMDTHGESFLLLRRRDREAGQRLIEQGLEPCVSQTFAEAGQLPRLLLETVGVGLLQEEAAIFRWTRELLYGFAPGPMDEAFLPVLRRAAGGEGSTSSGAVWLGSSTAAGEAQGGGATLKELCAALPTQDLLHTLITATLEMLVTKGFVKYVEEEPSCGAAASSRRLRATPFGSSSVRSCFSVEEALLVREELDRLRHTGLILADDLHLCYFMAPLREARECDWGLYRERLARLDDDRQRIANLIGVDEYLIDQLAMGIGGPPRVFSSTEAGKQSWFIARRFYLAMILADVLSEVPLPDVEQRYNVQRGQLQALMRSVSMFSSSITNFCRAMEWYSLEAVLASFVKRLGFGVKPDLLPLMEIKGVQPPRARALWNAGFRTPAQLAAVISPDELVERVKTLNAPDNKAARFFTKRSALMVIHAASLMVQQQIQQKMDELEELKGKYS